MALEVKFRYAPFPGGMVRMNRPDLGMVGEGYNLESLINKIKQYRYANGIPWGLEAESEISREVCRVIGGDGCQETQLDPLEPHPSRRLGVAQVVQGTQAMLRHWLNGKQLVSKEVATQRAQTCSHCRWNQGWSRPCATPMCGGLENVVRDFVGVKEQTGLEGQLHQCSLCGCWLSASVWVPLDVQWATLTDQQKAYFRHAKEKVNCWKCVD